MMRYYLKTEEYFWKFLTSVKLVVAPFTPLFPVLEEARADSRWIFSSYFAHEHEVERPLLMGLPGTEND